jgi:subtilisin family serine protease
MAGVRDPDPVLGAWRCPVGRPGGEDREMGHRAVWARRAATLALAGFLALVQALPTAAAGSAAGGRGPSTGAPPAATIEPGLLKALDSGAVDRFIVEFIARADLRAASRILDRTRRGQTVYDALRRTAATAQVTARALVTRTPGAKADSFWLTDVMLVHGDAALAAKLAVLPTVRTVRREKSYPLVKPLDPKVVLAAGPAPEWGIAKIGADQVWAEGITGQGVVVGTIDTGVDYTHPAIVEQYRGNNHDGSFSHDYNWWDPTGTCGDTPCDNVGHGTHTMGTIVGGDLSGPLPDIGVAPGAEWISAKGCETLDCSEGSLLSSGQFMLAPTDLQGNDPDPSRRPDIVSNSWGNDDPNDTFYTATVQAWRAAGIIPVFAAGNNGPGCGTAGSPGQSTDVISVGATDKSDVIGEFSSRGPSPSGKVSPNLTAPGVDIVSSVPGNAYQAYSGTSMATPHTAGTIALMISAKPSIAGDFGFILDALDKTAVDRPDDQCGSPDPTDNDPNYVYGEGRIDAKAAVDLVKTGGTLVGRVTDVTTTAPIAGARVSATDGDREFTATTDANGHYELFLAAGDYVVTARAFGYEADTAPLVTVVADRTTTHDFGLKALPRFTVSGHVTASEDGSPIEGARVLAVGTPVAPVTTDATGAYALVLPIGSFTLRASSGGCTETAFADIQSLGPDVVQDFSLFRKLDDFGHGCREIPFDWVDATTQSALYGDEIAGRLRLPFDFPFYGKTYSTVYLSENGYLNFLGPDQGNFIPVGIPSKSSPNAAIYLLWQDLHIDADAGIDYDTIGTAPDRTFVIEYQAMHPFGAPAAIRLTFEVKLHEDGRIDLLYGPNPADPGDGRLALTGIENETGSDALQISLFEGLIDPDSAIRIETVASGLVHGTVTDKNDDLPIAGATVRAAPGGRTATTADDGTYTLRLRPGHYALTASAEDYVDGVADQTVTDGSDQVRDFSLAASVAAVDPTSVDASVDFGSTTSAVIHLTNPGSAPLDWGARERDLGVEPPELPPLSPTIGTYVPGWHRPVIHGRLPATAVPTDVLPPGSLAPIIHDPAGDSTGPVDATVVRGGSDGSSEMAMSIDFTPETPIDQAVGEIYVDTDQDPSTGIPPSGLAGLPTQDIGAEYLISLFTVHDAEPVVVVIDLSTFEVVGTGPASVSGHTISFEAPLAALGGDDGAMDVDLVLGDPSRPMDYVPDVGHGTIEPFTDLSWLSESPEAGEVPAGASSDVTLALGTADLPPGAYHALVVFITNAPKQPLVPVEVNLTVRLPASFGALEGTVSDAHSGAPISGAALVVHTSWNGAPLDLKATTDSDGAYRVIGPAGTWPAEVSAPGYVTAKPDLTIVDGKTATADIQLHLDQPHASIDGGPFTFVLTPGRTGHATLTIGNPEGHEPLTFSVGEVDLGGTTESQVQRARAAAPSARHRLSLGADPNARTTRGLGLRPSAGAIKPRATGDVLASWPTGLEVPWGVGFDGNVWLSNIVNQGTICGDARPCTDQSFDTAGNPTGVSFEAPWATAFNADMAWDKNHGLLWQVNVGGDNGIYGLDPTDGSVKHVITGAPWSNNSQRGLAYDPASDTFYIGGWNEGIVYHVAGLDSPTPGETLGQCAPADPTISGLAWNASFGRLWMATNSESDTIYQIDPSTCATLDAIVHPDGGGFNGAGLELDAAGNLWTVGQASQTAYLIDSGLPNFSDAAWLSVEPKSGTLAPNDSAALDVAVDTAGLGAGVYRAMIVVQTNDPDHRVEQIPVTVVVPAFQQGVNSGGRAYTNASGDRFAADRSYGSGPFGYVGSSARRSTSHGIAGTDEDRLYKDQRLGMRSYRFDVPDGQYRVDLSFAELVERRVGARIFNVRIEGEPVIPYLDVVSEAGGRYVALDRSFVVQVSDGRLDIDFGAHIGDKAIINAILVTELPPGSPGT